MKQEKREIQEILGYANNNFEQVYKNSALLYSVMPYKKNYIATYYYYSLEEKSMASVNVVLSKINLADTAYLFFRFKNGSFFNKKINKKMVTIKTWISRFFKSMYLYNTYKFKMAYIDNEQENLENIVELYTNHLEHIKKQFIAIECSKYYNISYEWCIKNYDKLIKGKINGAPKLIGNSNAI